MNIIVIDTSQREASVFVAYNTKVLAQQKWSGDKHLSVKLIESIDQVLMQSGISLNQINRIAVHGGPGNYSALRAGIVTASTLAQALGINLVSVKGMDMVQILNEAIDADPVAVVKPQYI